MAGKQDKAKGTVKEAAGKATGNKDLERKGKIDKAKGKVKEKTSKWINKAGEAVDRTVHAGKREVNRDNM